MHTSNQQSSVPESSPQEATPDQTEDGALVERTLQGEAAAFEQLFTKYRQRLYGVVWRVLRDEDKALDVVQEAFVKAYQRLERLRGETRFYPWIRRIAVNQAIDVLRHQKRGVEVGFDEAQYGRGEEADSNKTGGRAEDRAEREAPDRQAQLSEFGLDLEKALLKISEAHRTVFMLHASEGMTYKEIADTLDVNIGTVMSRLFYARKKLQELLAPHLDGLGSSEKE